MYIADIPCGGVDFERLWRKLCERAVYRLGNGPRRVAVSGLQRARPIGRSGNVHQARLIAHVGPCPA